MKILIYFLLFSCIFITDLSAQQASDYFVTQTKDTVFARELKYGTSTWGELNYLSYKTPDGSPIVYKSKKSAPLVLSLCIDGKIIDRIPLRPNSKREIRYAERSVDGPLKVYLIHQDNSNSSTATVMYIFYLRMPDNTYYKINDKKNMENVIIPYLKKCDAFVKAYDGDYNNKEEDFIEMIKLYNLSCP